MDPVPETAAARARPGPKPRFSRDQVAETALEIVDREGFGALSLRAVARTLGVTPMALYTYVRSSDELAAMVIERLIDAKTSSLELPVDWKETLRVFARALAELIGEHPSMLQAYADGVVNTPSALRAAEGILEALEAAGLSRSAAAEAYDALHAVVLGHCILQPSAERRIDPNRADLVDLPAVEAAVRSGRRLGDTALDALVNLIIRSIEATGPRRGRKRALARGRSSG